MTKVTSRPADEKSLRPVILAVDGPSGIGKSTLLPIIDEKLRGMGINCKVVSNNDSSPFASLIRSLAQGEQHPYSLALAAAGGRAFLSEIRFDGLLLCDRYALSTFVYQVYSGVSSHFLYDINKPFLKGVFQVLLELSEEKLQQRRIGRQPNSTDWFKEKLPISTEIELFNRAAVFLRSHRHHVELVSAAGQLNDVASRIVEAFTGWSTNPELRT